MNSHGGTFVGSLTSSSSVPGPEIAVIALSTELTAGGPAFNVICDCGIILKKIGGNVFVWAHEFKT